MELYRCHFEPCCTEIFTDKGERDIHSDSCRWLGFIPSPLAHVENQDQIAEVEEEKVVGLDGTECVPDSLSPSPRIHELQQQSKVNIIHVKAMCNSIMLDPRLVGTTPEYPFPPRQEVAPGEIISPAAMLALMHEASAMSYAQEQSTINAPSANRLSDSLTDSEQYYMKKKSVAPSSKLAIARSALARIVPPRKQERLMAKEPSTYTPPAHSVPFKGVPLPSTPERNMAKVPDAIVTPAGPRSYRRNISIDPELLYQPRAQRFPKLQGPAGETSAQDLPASPPDEHQAMKRKLLPTDQIFTLDLPELPDGEPPEMNWGPRWGRPISAEKKGFYERKKEEAIEEFNERTRAKRRRIYKEPIRTKRKSAYEDYEEGSERPKRRRIKSEGSSEIPKRRRIKSEGSSELTELRSEE